MSSKTIVHQHRFCILHIALHFDRHFDNCFNMFIICDEFTKNILFDL